LPQHAKGGQAALALCGPRTRRCRCWRDSGPHGGV